MLEDIILRQTPWVRPVAGYRRSGGSTFIQLETLGPGPTLHNPSLFHLLQIFPTHKKSTDSHIPKSHLYNVNGVPARYEPALGDTVGARFAGFNIISYSPWNLWHRNVNNTQQFTSVTHVVGEGVGSFMPAFTKGAHLRIQLCSYDQISAAPATQNGSLNVVVTYTIVRTSTVHRSRPLILQYLHIFPCRNARVKVTGSL